MSIREETLEALQEAVLAVREWRQNRLKQIDDQIRFLRSADVSVSSLSKTALESTTDSAQELIDSILSP